MVCNEALLQRFVDNSEAARTQQVNNGIKQFKGVLRNLPNLQGEGRAKRAWLVNINQYDIHVETLLYYNPMQMVYGNRHLDPLAVHRSVLLPLLQRNAPTKSFDKVKVWKINMLDMHAKQPYDILLSLYDLQYYFESELPSIFDFENPVKLPSLIDLLGDYLGMIVSVRTLLGKVLLWKLPLYKRRLDKSTGKMMPLNPDELYRMKVLDIYG